MNIVNRTFSKNSSPKNTLTNNSLNTSSLNIELTDIEYLHSKKITTENDSTKILNDKPLISPRSNYLEKIKNCYLNNKLGVINKMLSISVHIFIMIIFEIYFYFNYVIHIEKNEFMGKINSYLNELNNLQLDSQKKLVISNLLLDNSDQVSSNLYLDYVKSMMEQNLLKDKLLAVAYNMAIVSGGILCSFLLFGFLNCREVKWRKIIVDNFLMFSFLGLFEYFFFTHVILHYSPVTDGEIKYTIYKGVINYFNQTGN